jgi:hypothetical protein
MLRAILIAIVALGAVQTARAQERGGAKTDVSGAFKSADAGSITIIVITNEGRRETREPPTTAEKTYVLAKNAEIVVRAGSGRGEVGLGRGGVGGGLFHEVKLADFAPGTRVVLTLSPDKETVESVVGEGPSVRGIIKGIDVDKHTVSLELPAQGARERGAEAPAAEVKTYALAPDAEISVDDGRGNRFSIREAKAVELAVGAQAAVRLSVNLKQIHAIHAEGPTLIGTVKSVDAAKRALTIAGPPQGRGGEVEEHRLVLATDAVVVVNDGKGRRLSIKAGKLADIPVGAIVTARLAVDQSFVMFLKAEGGTLTGQLKSVDAEKGVIALAIRKGRDEVEEKTFSLAKDVLVTLDGKSIKLAELKTGDDAPGVQVRMALDSDMVQSITANTTGRREE